AVIAGAGLFTGVSYVFKLIANSVAALPQGGSYSDVFFACGAYVVVLFVAQTLVRVSGFSGAIWATGARATARYSLTAYVTLHSRTYFSNRFAGSVSNKISHASNGIRSMIEHILWQFVELGVSIVVSFVLAYLASPLIAWIFLLWVSVVLAVNFYFSRR